jgi:hypothetical protein
MPERLLTIEVARILPRERIRKIEKEGKQWEKLNNEKIPVSNLSMTGPVTTD